MFAASWQDYLIALFSALFLVNGVPHFVHGVSGKQFPTPFSGAAGTLDGPVRNGFWGAANLAVGGALLWAIAGSLADPSIVIEMGLVGTLGGAFLAYAFGNPERIRGRNKAR